MPTSKQARDYLAIALDTNDLDHAIVLAKAVQPYIGVAKVGLQLFSKHGGEAVVAMRELGFDVFLDVKLHDIPNTVNKAAAVLGSYGAQYLTIHTVGGEAMLRAGIEGLTEGATEAGYAPPKVLGVTVLTSDPNASPELITERLSTAVAADCPGIICAAPDLATVKSQAPNILAVTPGIRPAGVDAHDQSRIATPTTAIGDGADLLVIGRAVTQAHDPADAAAKIHEEVERSTTK